MSARIILALSLLAISSEASQAATISREDATARVRSAGFTLVSKAEPTPGAWEVWASRDGIPYEVKVNASDGSLLAAVPVEDND
jgi:hypothetical protein